MDELLASVAAAVRSRPTAASQPYTPIALRQSPHSFVPSDHTGSPKIRIDTSLPIAGAGKSNQDDDAVGGSDSECSSPGGANNTDDEDDSDAALNADECEHEHYREMRRRQCTPLGAGPALLSKFHMGLKTPESSVRRAREVDGEVVCALTSKALEYMAERDAAVASVLASPSPNTYRILQVSTRSHGMLSDCPV